MWVGVEGGGGGFWKMLTMADIGGRGSKANADYAGMNS